MAKQEGCKRDICKRQKLLFVVADDAATLNETDSLLPSYIASSQSVM